MVDFAKGTLQKATSGNTRHHCRNCGWVVCQKCNTDEDGKTVYQLALEQWVSSKTHAIESMQGAGSSPRRSQSSSLLLPTISEPEPEPTPQPEPLEPEPEPEPEPEHLQTELSLELEQEQQVYSENITVTFEKNGALGIQFFWPAIGTIQPGSLAVEHSVLEPGLILIGLQGQSLEGMAMSAASARFREAGRPLTLTFRAPTNAEGESVVAKQQSGERGLELDAKMKKVCEFCHAFLQPETPSTAEVKSRGWNKKIQENAVAQLFNLVSSPKRPGAAEQQNVLSARALRQSMAVLSPPVQRGSNMQQAGGVTNAL